MKKKLKKLKAYLCPLLLLFCHVANASDQKIYHINGKTMGNNYNVSIVSDSLTAQDIFNLRNELEDKLEEINSVMSTWRKDSEISKINGIKANTQVRISDSLVNIINQSHEITKLTSGTFDITVAPLVKLWGFGPDGIPKGRPEQKEIDETLKFTGSDKLSLEGNQYSKTDDRVQLDLSGIAKGHAVDVIAETLELNGHKNYLVDIGGEIYAKGSKPDLKPWIIAIENPRKDASITDSKLKVDISGMAIATSGDYRHYFESDGTRFAHVIDPRTGWATQTNVVSATVIAPKCSTADALATAAMVMGAKKAINLADENELAIMLIEDNFGKLNTYKSKVFDNYISKK